eukprot:Hpha_TRINITY_DN8923_c0_g1::TRINITY_DN8923_c0_g1_i1::g.81039::m.81039
MRRTDTSPVLPTPSPSDHPPRSREAPAPAAEGSPAALPDAPPVPSFEAAVLGRCSCAWLTPDKGGYQGLASEPYCATAGGRHPHVTDDSREVVVIHREPGQLFGCQWDHLPPHAGDGNSRPVLISVQAGTPGAVLHKLLKHRVVRMGGRNVRDLEDICELSSSLPKEQCDVEIVFIHTKGCCHGNLNFQQVRPSAFSWRSKKRRSHQICEVCFSSAVTLAYCPLTGEPHAAASEAAALGATPSPPVPPAKRYREEEGEEKAIPAALEGYIQELLGVPLDMP